jgi:hypothetical protein
MNKAKQVLHVAAKLPFFDFGGASKRKERFEAQVGHGAETSTWAWLPGIHFLAHLSSDVAHFQQVLSRHVIMAGFTPTPLGCSSSYSSPLFLLLVLR